MSFQGHFDLDMNRAVQEQLVEAFDGLDTLPLSDVPPLGGVAITAAPGVYGLVLETDGVARMVYAGKASSLSKRLGEHAYKISGRQNIYPASVACKCLSVHHNWATYAPEDILIRHYKAKGECLWNGSGFGNNDPGREREQTNKPPDGFDGQYPIRHDLPCPWVNPGRHDVLDLLLVMKERLPYVLRFQADDRRRHREGHADFVGRSVEVPIANAPAEEVMRLIAEALPGWQATRFPSHFILYRERRDYNHGVVIGRGV